MSNQADDGAGKAGIRWYLMEPIWPYSLPRGPRGKVSKLVSWEMNDFLDGDEVQESDEDSAPLHWMEPLFCPWVGGCVGGWFHDCYAEACRS